MNTLTLADAAPQEASWDPAMGDPGSSVFMVLGAVLVLAALLLFFADRRPAPIYYVRRG